ncbi:DUF6454 family protein [Streptomyces sp. NPDC045431]|uniref:DUF6454 family protein n=1 Tax=Streptomyces sp. NPDC045431 TaxID=3155613 RepID=UPI0033C92399
MLTFTVEGELMHRAENRSHFVDYQTCVSAGGGHMVCTGITEYPLAGGGVFSLGGIAVVDIASGRIAHEAPVTVLSPAGRVVTYNAVHLETDGRVLRMLAVPDALWSRVTTGPRRNRVHTSVPHATSRARPSGSAARSFPMSAVSRSRPAFTPGAPR